MQALIVHESMFGNTAKIAAAVALGLQLTVDEVTLAGVADWPEEPDHLDLLVVGAPTHAFGLSRRSTRADAAGRPGFHGRRPELGLREWIDEVSRHHWPVPFAAFDTRVRHPRVPGSAARAAVRRLRRFGFTPVVPPETFWVAGVSGPLLDGEVERARDWGARLGARVAASHTAAASA